MSLPADPFYTHFVAIMVHVRTIARRSARWNLLQTEDGRDKCGHTYNCICTRNPQGHGSIIFQSYLSGLMVIRPLRPALFTEAAMCACRLQGSCLLSLQETPPQTQTQLACIPRPFHPRLIRSLWSVGQSRRMYLQSTRTTAKPCTCMRQALSSGAPFRSVKGCTAFTQVCSHS